MNSQRTDIQNREDLYAIVQLFYEKLFADTQMAPFFESFRQPDSLEKHLKVLVDFWDNIMFYSGTYTKNAMLPHMEMNKKIPFQSTHFELWMTHFKAAIDTLFSGEQAEVMKSRAQSIATVMQIKILHSS